MPLVAVTVMVKLLVGVLAMGSRYPPLQALSRPAATMPSKDQVKNRLKRDRRLRRRLAEARNDSGMSRKAAA